MSVLVYRDGSITAVAAATLLAAQIIEKPASVIGFDYAENLLPVYRSAARMTAEGLLDWGEVRAFVLSERARADGDRTIAKQLATVLLDKVSQRAEHRFQPNADRGDWSVVCNDFENDILAVGGLDLAVLSVGADGSVVNNFGAPELAPVTHVEHAESGRIVTVGISTIMAAKKLIVVLSGADKAEVASKMFNGTIVPAVPASYLQLHANAVFLLDEDAAAKV